MERERSVEAVVVFLPYRADAFDVLAFAALTVSLVDGGVDAGAMGVQLLQLVMSG